MCRAQRYERSPERIDTRAGHYSRKLHTQAGEVELKVPKLRRQTFETAIIERYRRRDISIEEAIVQMYLAGVSVRRVEDITQALWGTRVSSGTVSILNRKVYEHIERWRNQAIEGECAYVYLDGLALKRSWGGEIKNVSVLAAIGVDAQGYRRILGVADDLPPGIGPPGLRGKKHHIRLPMPRIPLAWCSPASYAVVPGCSGAASSRSSAWPRVDPGNRRSLLQASEALR